MEFLLEKAYGVTHSYRFAGPEWIRKEPRYNIDAKVPTGSTADDVSAMFQALLAERFMLSSHREMREMRAYELVVAKGGPKMKDSEATKASIIKRPNRPGITFSARMQTPADIALLCETRLDRPVVNKTGLSGKYDFVLSFVRDDLSVDPNIPPEDSSHPSVTLFDAVQQQLGLQLKPVTAKVDVIVIDRLNKVPTEN